MDWQQRRKPTEMAQLHQWKRAAEHLECGGSLLVNYAAGLTSGHMIAEAEKSEKRAAVAVASAAPATVHRTPPTTVSSFRLLERQKRFASAVSTAAASGATEVH